MTEEQVDWQRQVAEFASKSARHSTACAEAEGQVQITPKGSNEFYEAVYTLAVQRFHMDGAAG